jgi:tetratricopeptide (TPR) repeat protein
VQTVDLDTAVSEIRQACSSNPRHPFFFLVGAGLSHPTIPLASDIENECKTVALKFGRANEPAGKQRIDTYSHWFELAYPQPVDRQLYLRTLIEKKPISHANLRLAHLLLGKAVGNLVVTTNFDDLLSRALSLFGGRPIICDHPSTIERIDPERDDIQIVHVHGTYWFYDCCNLRGEIESRAEYSPSTLLTMGFLLDDLLSRRSPLVIGYGGWEGDVVMTALRRRLHQGRLPYKLYWFCHRATSIAALPRWLSTHPNVSFVIPDGDKPQGGVIPRVTIARQPSSQVDAGAPAGEGAAMAANEEIAEELTAQRVLDSLVQAFQLPAPDLTIDPVRFLATQLRASVLPYDVTLEGDLYFMRSVVERVERAVEREREAVEGVEAGLEIIRNAMRRSEYRDAIRRARGLHPSDLGERQLTEVIAAMQAAARGLFDDSDDEITGYDLIVAAVDELNRNGVYGEQVLTDAAEALRMKAMTLSIRNRYDEVVDVYREMIRRFEGGGLTAYAAEGYIGLARSLGTLPDVEGERQAYEDAIERYSSSADPRLQRYVIQAVIGLAQLDAAAERVKDALDALRAVVERFGPATNDGIQAEVASAMNEEAVILEGAGDSAGAVAKYDSVAERFHGSRSPAIALEVTRAAVAKATLLRTTGQRDAALVALDEVIDTARRLGEFAPSVRWRTAWAVVQKAAVLTELDRGDEAIALCDGIGEDSASASDQHLKAEVARAFAQKAATLRALKRDREAIPAYDAIIDRFSGSRDIVVRDLVATALSWKAYTLAMHKMSASAAAVYQDVIGRFGEAAELQLLGRAAWARVNLADLLKDGRIEETLQEYDRVIDRFGSLEARSVRAQVGRAMLFKANILQAADRKDEARIALGALVKFVGNETEGALGGLRKEAMEKLAVLQTDGG